MSKWPLRRLGEIITLEYGKPLPEAQRDNSGNCLVVGSNGVQGTHTQAIVKAPGIVVGRKGSAGQVNMFEGAFWPIDTTYYVVPKLDINLKWLYHCLKILPLNKLATSTGVPGLNRNDVYALSIPCPPLDEQERIVRILDEAEQLRRLRAEADRLAKELIPAVFYEMFGSIVASKDRYSTQRLEDICVSPAGIKAGPFGSSLKKECYTSEGPRVYGQEQIIAGDFAIGDYRVSSAKYDEMGAYAVLPGDVLISLVGTFGKVAVVPDNAEPGIINPRLVRLRVNQDHVLPLFLKHYLEMKDTQNYLQSLARGQTMGVLNATLLRGLAVPVPPLEKQRSFVSRVEIIGDFQAGQAASKLVVDKWLQSLLHRAFHGEP